MNKEEIRNFCIIAHIDHGKSTLADRLLEITKTLEKREIREQTLDSLDLEREKGITIKLKAVRMKYTPEDGSIYELNLIDTPGHVDFSYEVSRSLAACEGATLVVDATQGIQAQTLSNVHKAQEAGLKVIPVINKIDLPSSDVDKVSIDLVNTFGFNKDEIVLVSAKTGENVSKLLEEIIRRIPPPSGKEKKPFRALIFDSFFDEYLGVVALIKVVDGKISDEDIVSKEKIRLFATNAASAPEEIGFFAPSRKKTEILSSGEVGYIATNLKDIKNVRVGDTIHFAKDQVEPLPGYQSIKPFVFASLYPVDNDKFPQLRDALQKLSLNDSSLTYEPESSSALGFGFRCGFLGLLHSDVVQERLEREYNLELISSTPNVSYKVKLLSDSEVELKSPSLFPSPSEIKEILEPWINVSIFIPSTYVGSIIKLCESHRATLNNMNYLTPQKVFLEYEMPLSELVRNFYDELKSVSSGYASMDYEFIDFRSVDAVKLDVLIHGEKVDPLSQITVREDAYKLGRDILGRLKEVIPRHQFEVSLQAAISGKIVARENIPALRKDVLKKMSGGHRERKDKLLEKQKEGKRRLKRFGRVDIPQEAFRFVLTQK